MARFVFNKCCCCIDLKTGCYIISYVYLVCHFIMLVMTSMQLSSVIEYMRLVEESPRVHRVMVSAVIIIAVALVISIISLIFSIILIVGLHMNKPGPLQAFFVFGMISVLIVFICFIAKLVMGAFTILVLVKDIFTIVYSIYLMLVIRSQYCVMREA